MEENNSGAMAPTDGDASRNPFQPLIGLPGIDSVEDIFADADMGEGNPFAGGDSEGGNPFAGGGNPFAGGGASDDEADPVATFAEDTLGDFSNDGAAPTDIGMLEVGTTVVTATQQGEPRDIDYVTFTVAEGTELDGLTIGAYEAERGNLAFLGLERGDAFETASDAGDASGLLGGLSYGSLEVSNDVLSRVGSLYGAEKFDGSLEAGDYTLWFNQTGMTSTVSLDLEVSEAGDDQAGGNPFGGGGAGGGNPFGGGGEGGGNPFAGGGAGGGNPFAGGGNPFAGGDDSEGGNPFSGGGNPFAGGNSEGGNPFAGGDSEGGNPFSGGGNPFAGQNTDQGEGNTDNGNGNWFEGDNNIADGNGNWSFGDDNQVNGNGNWNLSGPDSIPFDLSMISGGSGGGGNPFAGTGNPAGGGSGNNPAFAGGSGQPAPSGEDMPASMADPDANNNQVSGNGNWNFGNENEAYGNGNWNFGQGNRIEGNGNWNFGDNNTIAGSGNRPTGDGNNISGNGNRVSGDNNQVNGNRFDISEDGVNVFGNADRYFSMDADGNIELVEDESSGDPNMTFEFDSITGQPNNPSAPMTMDPLTAPGGEVAMPVDGGDGTGAGAESLDDLLRQSPFGRLLDIEGVDGPADIFGNLGGGEGGGNPIGGGMGDGSTGGNPFGGGDAFGGGMSNPFAGWNPLTDGNPFAVSDESSMGM